MATVKIKDLPKDIKISREEMDAIRGGLGPQPEPPDRARLLIRTSKDFRLYSNLYRLAQPTFSG